MTTFNPMTSQVIGIIGSRRRATPADFNLLAARFYELYLPGDSIVSGGCPTGGDAFAEQLAEALGLRKVAAYSGVAQEPVIPPCMVIHYPDKLRLDPELMLKAPRAAYAKINYARNTLIAQDATVMLALVAADRKGGTEDTLKTFKKLGKTAVFLV